MPVHHPRPPEEMLTGLLSGRLLQSVAIRTVDGSETNGVLTDIMGDLIVVNADAPGVAAGMVWIPVRYITKVGVPSSNVMDKPEA